MKGRTVRQEAVNDSYNVPTLLTYHMQLNTIVVHMFTHVLARGEFLYKIQHVVTNNPHLLSNFPHFSSVAVRGDDAHWTAPERPVLSMSIPSGSNIDPSSVILNYTRARQAPVCIMMYVIHFL